MIDEERTRLLIGMRVRDKRERKKLSQIELGKLVGLHSTAINHIEAGRRCPSVYVLLALCQALKLSPNYILKGGY